MGKRFRGFPYGKPDEPGGMYWSDNPELRAQESLISPMAPPDDQHYLVKDNLKFPPMKIEGRLPTSKPKTIASENKVPVKVAPAVRTDYEYPTTDEGSELRIPRMPDMLGEDAATDMRYPYTIPESGDDLRLPPMGDMLGADPVMGPERPPPPEALSFAERLQQMLGDTDARAKEVANDNTRMMGEIGQNSLLKALFRGGAMMGTVGGRTAPTKMTDDYYDESSVQRASAAKLRGALADKLTENERYKVELAEKMKQQDIGNALRARQLDIAEGKNLPDSGMSKADLELTKQQRELAFKMLDLEARKAMASDKDKARLELEEMKLKAQMDRLDKEIAAGKFREKTGATGAGAGVAKPTPGAKKVDEAFAKQYAEYVANGGYASAVKAISQLERAAKVIAADPKITGRPFHQLPQILKDALGPMVSPNTISVKDDILQVGAVGLKQVYGGNPTNQEGKDFLSRIFNDRLSPQENSRRLENMLSSMKASAEQKQRAMKYFEENGTLAGFEGRIPTLAEVEAEIVGGGGGSSAGGATQQFKTEQEEYEYLKKLEQEGKL